MDASKTLGGVQWRPFKRLVIINLTFILSATIILSQYKYSPLKYRDGLPVATAFNARPIPQCGGFVGSNDIWEKSQTKYRELRDDKFTIAIQTYRREKELNGTLHGLLAKEIPSLQEVVVVWNDLEATPPPDYISKHGVRVRHRQSKENSLNQKLWPDPAYRTQAIFLSDDDLYYEPQDLEFVFQTWRKFGRRRITGRTGRCVDQEPNGKWKYSFCSKDNGHDFYNMILSNLAFAHISFLDYYFSQDENPKRIRAYVDEHFNCEDIALNYFTSLLTGEGPLLVMGKDLYMDFRPKIGISTKPGHLEARSKCINDFNEMFKCMPLFNETSHIEPGLGTL